MMKAAARRRNRLGRRWRRPRPQPPLPSQPSVVQLLLTRRVLLLLLLRGPPGPGVLRKPRRFIRQPVVPLRRLQERRRTHLLRPTKLPRRRRRRRQRWPTFG